MATRESIEFNLRQALQQAEKLENISDELRILSKDKLGGSLQTLSQNWKGVNATSYIKKGNTLQTNINSSSSQLREIASTIRTIAWNIYNAEMEALRIAEEREYNN